MKLLSIFLLIIEIFLLMIFGVTIGMDFQYGDYGPLIFKIIALLFILGVIIAIEYNGLVTKRNSVSNAWSSIDVQLNRRADLIPNLVNTVKGYSVHETEILTSVAQARSGLINADNVQDLNKANSQLSSTLKTLFAVAEAYPDLKADTNFRELQVELSDTENKISIARTIYNDTVMDYNNSVGTFPDMILANLFGFHEADYFRLSKDAIERRVPKVEF